ncbi:cytochrome P450 [Aspergillus homomorphus CBS 101889]|uniref:Benzoate 4-monooxygenase cytochrome P450 n=1 Tax=Aspergillus homomorphus (strain CBS 101889) TaxID=1450537 RepID=A0A395HMI4_ASPHC|nr:benzoate 4-monooxygenase cytochrome P450 [Aspergillus homomorphus CBS 101889]RAL08633.1 benzoate 4-monooxygenase cytochrome P450 [Aspergillus homomorphus CBS 101889]
MSLTMLSLLIVSYYILRSVYRLHFHPLSKIPGPPLAVVTRFHEFYYDVVKGGKFFWEVEKMHKKYGPIVRINPREVHIIDPAMYDEIYAGNSRKRNKDSVFVSSFASPFSAIATIDHDLHRARRGPLNPFFSKKAVMDLSAVILEKVKRLSWHLERAHADGAIIALHTAFVGLTGDIITHYLYGQDNGYLSDPDLTKRNLVWELMFEGTSSCHLFRFLPFIPRMIKALPARWMRLVRPKLAQVYAMHEQIAQQSQEVPLNNDNHISTAGGSIYQALTDPSLSPAERSLARLRDESFIVLIAGTETTAATLTFATYHLLRNRSMFLQLREELKQVMPTPKSEPRWSQLEQLPYLTAIINEALRLSATPMRPARVAPCESLHYKQYTIPPGTPISTISYFIHRNPQIFPDPHAFRPERWLEAAERGENLARYLVPFARGSRICIGMNLAYAELYMTIASIVRRFDLELCGTHPEDMQFVREKILQRPDKGVWTLKARVAAVAAVAAE